MANPDPSVAVTVTVNATATAAAGTRQAAATSTSSSPSAASPPASRVSIKRHGAAVSYLVVRGVVAGSWAEIVRMPQAPISRPTTPPPLHAWMIVETRGS